MIIRTNEYNFLKKVDATGNIVGIPNCIATRFSKGENTMKQGFDYGPFAPGDKVLVYHDGQNEWYIGTVQKQKEDSVFIEDESGLLHCGYYDKVSVHECFPANHSDITKDITEYEGLSVRMAELEEDIREFLQQKAEVVE